jgi:pimeloyl-ACP methyl ester carboxylesterase
MLEARRTSPPPQEEPSLAVGSLPRHTASLPCGEVAYLRHGSGPPLLLVHGIPTSARLWEPLLGDLGERFDCIAVDLLGLGRSRPAAGADLASPGQADMLAALLDHLEIDALPVVAHDQGGAHVQQMIVRHGERMTGVVFCDVVCFDNWIVPAVAVLERVASSAPLTGWLGRTRLLERLMAVAWPLPQTVHRGRIAPELIDDWFSALRAGGPGLEAWRAYVRAQSNRWTLEAVPALEAWDKPAHVIWATDDRFLPVRWAARLAATLPTAPDPTLLPQAGHFFQAEIPRTAARTLLTVLDRVAPR